MTDQQDLLLQRFDQVGLLVRDIDEATQKVEDVLGLSATVKRDAYDEGYRAAIIPVACRPPTAATTHDRRQPPGQTA